jgi:DNA-binding MarR family transcriptional regulator
MTRRSTAGKAQPKFLLKPTISCEAVLDPDGGDRTFRQLLYDFASAAAKLETARAYLASKIGITSPQYNIIMVIAQYEGDSGLTVNEIAEHLHVRGTFITAESKKLEKLGLLVKGPNPADARSVLIRLSKEGEQAVDRLHSELNFVNDHLFRRLSAKDFKSLSKIVASLLGDFTATVGMLELLSKTPASHAGDLSQFLASAAKR